MNEHGHGTIKRHAMMSCHTVIGDKRAIPPLARRTQVSESIKTHFTPTRENLEALARELEITTGDDVSRFEWTDGKVVELKSAIRKVRALEFVEV